MKTFEEIKAEDECEIRKESERARTRSEARAKQRREAEAANARAVGAAAEALAEAREKAEILGRHARRRRAAAVDAERHVTAYRREHEARLPKLIEAIDRLVAEAPEAEAAEAELERLIADHARGLAVGGPARIGLKQIAPLALGLYPEAAGELREWLVRMVTVMASSDDPRISGLTEDEYAAGLKAKVDSSEAAQAEARAAETAASDAARTLNSIKLGSA